MSFKEFIAEGKSVDQQAEKIFRLVCDLLKRGQESHKVMQSFESEFRKMTAKMTTEEFRTFRDMIGSDINQMKMTVEAAKKLLKKNTRSF